MLTHWPASKDTISDKFWYAFKPVRLRRSLISWQDLATWHSHPSLSKGGRRKENICGRLPTSSTPAFDISLPVDTNIIPLFSTQPTKPIHSIRVNDFAIESEPDVDGMFQSA